MDLVGRLRKKLEATSFMHSIFNLGWCMAPMMGMVVGYTDQVPMIGGVARKWQPMKKYRRRDTPRQKELGWGPGAGLNLLQIKLSNAGGGRGGPLAHMLSISQTCNCNQTGEPI